MDPEVQHHAEQPLLVDPPASRWEVVVAWTQRGFGPCVTPRRPSGTRSFSCSANVFQKVSDLRGRAIQFRCRWDVSREPWQMLIRLAVWVGGLEVDPGSCKWETTP